MRKEETADCLIEQVFSAKNPEILAHLLIVSKKFMPSIDVIGACKFCIEEKLNGNPSALLLAIKDKIKDEEFLTIFKDKANSAFRNKLRELASSEDLEWLREVEISTVIDPYKCLNIIYRFVGAEFEEELLSKYIQALNEVSKKGINLNELSAEDQYEVIAIAAEFSAKCRNNATVPLSEERLIKLVDLLGQEDAERLLSLIASNMDAKMP